MDLQLPADAFRMVFGKAYTLFGIDQGCRRSNQAKPIRMVFQNDNNIDLGPRLVQNVMGSFFMTIFGSSAVQ